MGTYWENRVLRSLYARATPDSDETIIDTLWVNTLRRSFLLNDFAIEAQAHPSPTSGRKCNIIVSSDRGTGLRPAIIVENKSREYEGSATKWEEAKDQVLGQLKVARAAAPLHAQRTLYAIVSVGLYSRFYRLHAGEGYLERYDDDDDDDDDEEENEEEAEDDDDEEEDNKKDKAKPYHYRKDRGRIHDILNNLARDAKLAS